MTTLFYNVHASQQKEALHAVMPVVEANMPIDVPSCHMLERNEGQECPLLKKNVVACNLRCKRAIG
jgi:hypothetical protein